MRDPMGEAIGQILPTAIGVAVSPLPIVAVALMLVTPKGRVNGPAFVLGWIAGLVAGAASIAGAGLDGGDEAVVFGVFALIATVGVGTPVVLSAVLGDRARAMLDGLKDWLAANNAVIMAVLLLVLGAKVLGDAISGLSA
jgi:Sap, sulfolipid-1-addressing protein